MDTFFLNQLTTVINSIKEEVSRRAEGNFGLALEYHIGTLEDFQWPSLVTAKRIRVQIIDLCMIMNKTKTLRRYVVDYDNLIAAEKTSEAQAVYQQITKTYSDINNMRSIKNLSSRDPNFIPKEPPIYMIKATVNDIRLALERIRTSLESDITTLQNPKYDNVTITGSNIRYTINIRNLANIIINNIKNLQMRIKNAEDKIFKQLDNLIKFESGENIIVNGSSATGTTQTSSGDTQVTFGENDTLWDLAVKYYGDGTKYTLIQEANDIENVRNIPTGMVLVIPGVFSDSVSNDSNTETIENDVVPNLSMEVINDLPTYETVTRSNWAVSAAPMMAGEYDPPMHVNVETGRMEDIHYNEISITDDFGEVRSDGIHRGVDFTGGDEDLGTPIYTLGPGVVIDCDSSLGPEERTDKSINYGCGNYVRILHETIDENGEVTYIISTYEHLAYVDDDIAVGTVVDSQNMIGAMGSSGNSSGPHLHLEVTEVPGLTAEDLEGKTAEEIVEIVNTPNGDYPGLMFNYGRDYWIDPTEYFRPQGWIE